MLKTGWENLRNDIIPIYFITLTSRLISLNIDIPFLRNFNFSDNRKQVKTLICFFRGLYANIAAHPRLHDQVTAPSIVSVFRKINPVTA